MLHDEDEFPATYLAASHDDAKRHLQFQVQRCNEASEGLREAVMAARAMKVPWTEIGTVLGLSRQAAQERLGGRLRDELVSGWHALETYLAPIADRLGVAGKPLTAVRLLGERGDLSAQSVDEIAQIFRARARAVHDPAFEITVDEVEHLTDLAVSLASELWVLREDWLDAHGDGFSDRRAR